jgi:imidazolonepropionase-like amidohydrolase
MTIKFWRIAFYALAITIVSAGAALAEQTLLVPERVFDGETMHDNWAVLVDGDRIIEIGRPSDMRGVGVVEVDLPGQTLLPGLIEGHSHVLLHPYDETPWNDQVLIESWAERSIRAANHLNAHLMAGFTTLRDLGSEGAGYTDVGVREALGKGIMPGPRLIVAGRAMVVTGSYGPRGFNEQVTVPLGAEPVDGDRVSQVARDQIGHGVDFIKVYADYRWGPNGESMPTFTRGELMQIREVAELSGRYVVAHAGTVVGMENAIAAGVRSIEHGDEATAQIFAMMAEKGVFWCPTLAAGEAISAYNGWQKGIDPDPARIAAKKITFMLALAADVPMCMGSDVGVFDHGDSVWEMELMVEYGMDTLAVLQSATSNNARMLGMEDMIGTIGVGMIADLIAVEGNPVDDITLLRAPAFIMQGGERIK